MRVESLKALACPKCLGNLTLENEVLEKDEIKKGKLHCLECDPNFPIVDGVAIFGIRKKNLSERLVESNSEGLWASEIVSMDDHVSYARRSSLKGELAIKKLDKMIKAREGANKRTLRVLDIGAGMGFQS